MPNSIRSASKLLAAILLIAGLSIALPAGCPVTPPDDGTNGDNGGDGTDDTKGDSGLTGKFVGAAVCVTCHSRTHNNWSETLHARALDSLEAIGQGTNAACLGCHTVGFGQSGGFVDRATTDALAGVGCESCHGAARDHVENVADGSLRPEWTSPPVYAARATPANTSPTSRTGASPGIRASTTWSARTFWKADSSSTPVARATPATCTTTPFWKVRPSPTTRSKA